MAFSHFNQRDEVARKLIRALRPGGVFLLMDFTGKKASMRWRDRIARRIYQWMFKFDYWDVTEEFPKAAEEAHFPCLGGQISIFFFRA
jgi:ubiquinone/menaquinone biosynthesis C-methylase UbiE